MPLSMSMKGYKDKGNARLKKPFTASCIIFIPLLGAKFLVKALTYPEGIAGQEAWRIQITCLSRACVPGPGSFQLPGRCNGRDGKGRHALPSTSQRL
jgi:hypothetical protein